MNANTPVLDLTSLATEAKYSAPHSVPDSANAGPRAMGRPADPAPERVASALALLEQAAALSPARLSSSLGVEDMVLLDLIDRTGLPIEVFTLDTGRLHEETHDVLRAAQARYGRRVQVWFPQAGALQELLARDGANGFLDSVEQRKACCTVRKVEPLARALAGARAWITGLRAGQSAARAGLPARETDSVHGLEKFNPLHDWTGAQVWDYARSHAVPVNALHARFFPSIGCAPCTRAVTPGEDPRAGRWWWEQGGAQECGLHPVRLPPSTRP